MRKTTIVFLILSLIMIAAVVACGPAEEAEEPATPTLEPQVTEPVIESYPAPVIDDDTPEAYPGLDESAYPAPVFDPGPAFDGETPSFDGKIAFHSERYGNLQLFVLDGESGAVEQLATGAVKAYEPAWSPDCRSILYSHELGVNNSEIYKINSDGQLALPLLEEVRANTLEWAPAWAPAGDLVAFQSNPGAQINICFASATGALTECMVQSGYSNAHPSWSPDGSQLLFISNRDGNWDMYLSDSLSGENAVNLTDNGGVNFHPRFSPDGQRIVFESDINGSFDIFMIDDDGANLKQLTLNDSEDSDPSWMGNDTILYASNQLGDWELFWMDTNGENQTRVTFQPGTDRGPAWCLPE